MDISRGKSSINLYFKMKNFIYKYCLSDEFLLKTRFKKRLKRKLNLNNPKLYNDKLQWLKLNWYDDYARICADKYEVRKVVEKEIGKKYLNKMYGVYERVEDINLDELPNSFVLKGTHGSGLNIICKDKTKIDWDLEFIKMKRWLKYNYYWQNREWVYKDITPRIICEKFIEQKNNDNDTLRDYRFFCFNGEPKFITVDFNINDKKNTRRNVYNTDWSLTPYQISYPRELNENLEKPEKLDEMLYLSEKLSKRFPHSRVDFYYVEGQVIFGEITFFHQSGMGKISPQSFEEQMGDWLVLSK